MALVATACSPGAETRVESDSGSPAVRGLEQPPLLARVAIDKATATVGDRLRFSLEIERDPEVEVSKPEPLSDFAGLEVLATSREVSDESSPRPGETIWFELRAEQAGSYVIEPIELSWRDETGGTGSVMTTELFVEIESMLPGDGSAQDIRDIKPLQRIPEPDWRWIALLVGVWTVLALVLWRFVRAVAPVAPPALQAHEIAFRELDRLRRTDFDNLEALHAYYYSISSVIRSYIESRFGLNATDLTREEIVVALPGVAGLTAPQAASLERFLEATDEVKYAKRLPETDEIESNYELALRLVEETVPVESDSGGRDSELQPRAESAQKEPAGSGSGGAA